MFGICILRINWNIEHTPAIDMKTPKQSGQVSLQIIVRPKGFWVFGICILGINWNIEHSSVFL